jgi:DNA-binding CsgD family transcriptional regulator
MAAGLLSVAGLMGQDDPLTTREKEVVCCLAEGLTSKEIGAKIGISAKTVEFHRHNIMRKLEVRGVAGVVRYAIRLKLIDP